MRRPMLLLAHGIAVLDLDTRLARLETDIAPLHIAALGAAVGRCIFVITIIRLATLVLRRWRW
jgi:hypothetical protein